MKWILLLSLLSCASGPRPETEKNLVTTDSKAGADVKLSEDEAKSAAEVSPEPKRKRPKPRDEDLALVEAKYSNAGSIKMKVKKSLLLSLLERTDVYEGQIFLQGKDKVRLEFNTPMRSVAVLNAKDFWVIDYPPKDSKDKVRVLKSSLGAKSQSQMLVTSLMGNGSLLDHFKVHKKSKKDGVILYSLKPLSEEGEIVSMDLKVNAIEQNIIEVSYEDELENITKFEFSNIEMGAKIKEDLFKYTVPSGAEVSQL